MRDEIRFDSGLIQHYQLYKAEQDYKLPLRLAFIGLLGCCDEEWNFHWHPHHLKIRICPYDELDFGKILDALLASGFITKRELNGQSYGSILPFLYQ